MRYLVYPDGKVLESKEHQVNEGHLNSVGVRVVEADDEAGAREEAQKQIDAAKSSLFGDAEAEAPSMEAAPAPKSSKKSSKE